MSDRLHAALAAIDAANAEDPTVVTVRGRSGPKETLHAELVTAWVEQLAPEGSEALRLAARGHHFRRWTMPRTTYPAGRSGYLKWRKALHAKHAEELGALLDAAGYDDETIARVQALVRKEGLGRDPEVQVLEDALCLVFLETQLDDVAARLEPGTLDRVVVKTAAKMSEAGRARIADVPLTAVGRRVLDEALSHDVVTRYLAALAAHDWPAVAATLHPAVHRVGPYGDVFDGRASYAEFLEATISALSGYALVINRTTVSGTTAVVELSEAVDDGGGRLHTEEAVVFDITDGLIAHVAVFLRQSEHLSGT